MTDWQDYVTDRAGDGHTVVGALKLLRELESPQLDNQRDILVYLPPSYETGRHDYPVLYLHDGQNLFDAGTSFAGEWQVDETMEALSRQGLEAIIVGIPNAGKDRMEEYSPFHQPSHGGGRGDQYLDFVVNTVKPLVEAEFRARPGREHTGIMGSSLGGLISLYAFFRHPEIFGFAGAMSPSFWFAGGAIYPYIQAAPFHPGRIYLDAGTREHGEKKGRWPSIAIRSRRYYAGIRRMQRILVKKGYRPRQHLLYVEEKWAHHEESAWARRLPKAIRFFLNGQSNLR
jgi:predicted alpha/beta superfamily hydrolase